MVDAPGRRNDASGRYAHPPTRAATPGRACQSSGRSYLPSGLTRSASRRVGAFVDTGGTFDCDPNADGGGTVVPAGDSPVPPPPTGDGAAATCDGGVTRFDTGTGMFRMVCSSHRSRNGKRSV